ncbi:hypothetical protein GCM10027046_09460 [Uliginosibacterium flavum]|uniref:SPOR domain-containing protein n=1 Tax=Uliginosibacterium flavum TaxID=1396831 RepID=A0ABV2TIC3_9RHOO
MADNDVQLDLKKRSRRRLVGAIALALLAAIVLPMAMDSEPKPASNELQIRIPSQEGSNFASRLITGTPPPPVSPVLPAQSKPSPSAPQVLISAPVVPQSSLQTVEEPAAQSTAATKPEAAASKPAAPPKPPTEAQRAREILDGKPAERAAAGQKLYVQLGVFRDEANAREVLNRAGAAGVKAVGQKTEDKTRVRAGPFADRAAADAAVSKLKKAGLNGIVTGK